MDEQAKIILYKQLMKIEIITRKKEDKLVSWGEFATYTAREALGYAIDYRDKIYTRLSARKSFHQIDKKEFYLELPDMDLEGEDLSNIYLHHFMAGYSKERNNGKKIFITSGVNLKDTNITINMATIQPIVVSEDGVNIKEISADIKKCDFRGCKIFGKFQNSKAKLSFTDECLPQEYVERLKKYKVPSNAEILTDNFYADMIDGKIVRVTSGTETVKQLVDYDLTDMKKDIWKYRDVIMEHQIDISYTGAFIKEYGVESVGRENYYINLELRAKEAYQAGDMEFVDKVFNSLDKEEKRKLITLALRDRRNGFSKKIS